MKKLAENEVKKNIEKLSGWVFLDISISKEFIFENFMDAVNFVNKIAVIAEKFGHHPDILLYSWNKVKIYNSTHNAGGVTIKDIELAEEIEKII